MSMAILLLYNPGEFTMTGNAGQETESESVNFSHVAEVSHPVFFT
jgi:hypothetical protein